MTHNIVAIEGNPLPEWTADEKAVYSLLLSLKKEGSSGLSSLGLSRWIRKDPSLAKPDKKIAAAAERLWAGMMIAKDDEGTYFAT
jgi:hypothetical protein